MSEPIKICLFDWRRGGHNELYMRRAAEALLPAAKVVIAAPDPLLEALADLPVSLHSLGRPRPEAAGARPNAEHARAELALLRSVTDATRPDQCLHLHADSVLRWLNSEPSMPAPITITLHNAWAHYPEAFGNQLGPGRRLRGAYLDHKVRRWRGRADAHVILTLDPFAADRWAKRTGVPVRWLPEPRPEMPSPDELGEPRGCVLFGALNRRKGVDLLADAIALAPTDLRVNLAGYCLPGYENELTRSIARMRAAGAEVEAPAPTRLPPGAAMVALAEARCAVLPYRWHPGTSRVLTEAATMGTPVVGPSEGLIGHYISSYGLGVAVDPSRPRELRQATLGLAHDHEARGRYAPALRRYAEAVGGERFELALRALYGLPGRVDEGAPRKVGAR